MQNLLPRPGHDNFLRPNFMVLMSHHCITSSTDAFSFNLNEGRRHLAYSQAICDVISRSGLKQAKKHVFERDRNG